jgi:hypothetical protein
LVMIGQKLSLDQKSDSWLYLKIGVDSHFSDWHCLLTIDCGKKIMLWVSLCQFWTWGSSNCCSPWKASETLCYRFSHTTVIKQLDG